MEGHTGIISINFLPTEKVSFNVSSAYTDSKAHMESFELSGTGGITFSDMSTRYNDNFSQVPNYSDLHIRELDLTLGASYMINKNFSLSLEYNYLYYGDADPYLGTPTDPYDTTGRAHIGMLTLTYSY